MINADQEAVRSFIFRLVENVRQSKEKKDEVKKLWRDIYRLATSSELPSPPLLHIFCDQHTLIFHLVDAINRYGKAITTTEDMTVFLVDVMAAFSLDKSYQVKQASIICPNLLNMLYFCFGNYYKQCLSFMCLLVICQLIFQRGYW